MSSAPSIFLDQEKTVEISNPVIRNALAVAPAGGDWITSLKHVVILMLENRSFDHMFGSLRGVRGFGDPRPAPTREISKTVWNQPYSAGSAKRYAYPFHVNTLTTLKSYDLTPKAPSKPEIPSAPLALSDTAEHEPSRKLLGQLPDGEAVPQLQDRMATVSGLHVSAGGPPGHQPLPDAPVQLDTAASVQ